MKVIAVDFDGVIHDEDPAPGRRMGKPVEGTQQAMMDLANRYKVVVFTVRAQTPAGTKAVADWLDYFGIPCDEITAIKPNAEYYIDDRAVHFDNWEDLMPWLLR